MRHCRNDAAGLSEPEWYRLLTVVARCDDAERWAHELSKAYPKYARRETQRKLKQASGGKVAPVTCAYVQTDLNGSRFCAECLFRGNINSPIAIGRIEAVEAGTEAELEATSPSGNDPPLPEQPKPAEAAATKIEKFTDLGNARRFVARYRGSVLYCEAWSRWFLWDSMRWAEDERLEVFARASDLIRSLYPVAKKIKDEDERKAFLSHLIKSESHRSIHAMVTLAKSDRAVARHPDDFDKDLWLCTVKNGTLDLRTGQLRPHGQQDMITKLAPVVYDPSARCPNWLAFLHMIMLGRQSLVDFLKRALGSSLTGVTSDKAMFILYGPGGDNGKSTMVEVMEMLLGNYARRTPVETFLKKREGSIPNDIARLRGARFVWAAENDRGVRLAESLIKEMTGGDRMAARFLHGEFFEFMLTFKIWYEKDSLLFLSNGNNNRRRGATERFGSSQSLLGMSLGAGVAPQLQAKYKQTSRPQRLPRPAENLHVKRNSGDGFVRGLVSRRHRSHPEPLRRPHRRPSQRISGIRRHPAGPPQKR